MKRIIVTEEQARLIIEKLISEQGASQINVKTVYGGTDANRISHAYLSKAYGLPDGARYENYYYGANIQDILAISADPQNVSKFLSIFKPLNAYDKSSKGYYDYISINNDPIENSGTKVFKFYNGVVYAAHNGLLALARAMVNLGGAGANMKISLGSSKSGEDASNERITGSVTFNTNQALDKSPVLNSFVDALTSLAIRFEFLKNTTSLFFDAANIQEIRDYVDKLAVTIITGNGGFMDPTKKDKIISELTPKGFVTKLDYDLTGIKSQLEKLQGVDDMIKEDDDYYAKPKYNENKRNQLNAISDNFLPNLIEKMREAHNANFKLYVENYLPEDKNTIIPLIPRTKFITKPLGDWHYHLFHSYRGGKTSGGTELQQQSKKVGSGKITN